MNAVKEDHLWILLNPRNSECVEKIPARQIWNEICESAWRTGDPGVAFMDRVHESQPECNKEKYGPIDGSNPCGEEWTENGNSCNLGSINLARYWNAEERIFDYDLLAQHVRLAVRFLDNVIDINWFPFEYQREINLDTRRIGLGVMGWADLLIMMLIPYNSQEALDLATEISRFITKHARMESVTLGSEKGKPRPEMNARNSSLTTIAPTGSISVIAGCSSGIEPHFALFWIRKSMWSADGKHHEREMLEMPNPLRKMMQEHHPTVDFDDEGLRRELTQMAEHEQRQWVADKLGSSIARIFSTAHSVDASEHVKMLAAWQKNTDNGVSKTINLTNHATVADIDRAFREAHELGCKSVTVYRDGSKDEQVLTSGSGGHQSATDASSSPLVEHGEAYGRYSHKLVGQAIIGGESVDAPVQNNDQSTATSSVEPKRGKEVGSKQERMADRPKVLNGITTKVETGHGQWYFTINVDPADGKPIEVFIAPRNNDPCVHAASTAVAKLVSLSLRSGVDVELLAEGLQGIDCGHVHWLDGKMITSAWDALAQLLVKTTGVDIPARVDTGKPERVVAVKDARMNCPSCGGRLVHSGGCVVCESCRKSSCD